MKHFDQQRVDRRTLLGSAAIGLGSLALSPVVGATKALPVRFPKRADDFQYNGYQAAAYADQYALQAGEDGSVSQYFGQNGQKQDDCTNFVSNCMYAGGFPMTNNWYSQLYFFGMYWDYTTTWSSAPDLYNFITGNWNGGAANAASGQVYPIAYGAEIGVLPGATMQPMTGLVPGDLVFFSWWGQEPEYAQNIDHVAILTNPGFDSSGYLDPSIFCDLIDQHTAGRQGEFWSGGAYNQHIDTTLIHLVHIYNNTASSLYLP